MLQARWAVCATLLVFSATANSKPESPNFEVRLLRVEGAASGVRKSAERLSEIALFISNSKMLSDIPKVTTELSDLHRMVIGARMATDIAIQEMQATTETQ